MAIEEARANELPDDQLSETQRQLETLKAGLGRVIQGKPLVIDQLVLALVANGSLLMEDVPGVGKTTLAKALAGSIDADFNRVQFTPDLLPADILGGSIYNPQDGSFNFRSGPIFCNVLLADEINRASPRTQAALLEAMAEQQVTIENQRRELLRPFVVIATENSIEFQGTYPLPEAQLDRFMMQLTLGYPAPDDEVQMLELQAHSHPLDHVEAVLSREDILIIQDQAQRVEVNPAVSRYMVELSVATRRHAKLKLGVSPRGTIMLYRACQARALSEGRSYVLPDDVQALAESVLAHRLVLNTKAKYDGTSKIDIIREALTQVPVPV
jgi:MoxR-like ATPase